MTIGHYIRRMSLGYRHPNDAPDKYVQAKLAEFDKLTRETKLASDYYDVVEEQGRPHLRYLKPPVASYQRKVAKDKVCNAE